MKTRYFLLILFVFGLITSAKAEIEVTNLRCEMIKNPLGIGIHQPQLSWIIRSDKNDVSQSTYEIIVSDEEMLLHQDTGNMWKTGRIDSGETTHIVYEGNPLRAFTRYFWKVRIYEAGGKLSAWSDPAWFETAMLSENDWQANWIGDGQKQFERDEDFYGEDSMPLFRRDFKLDKSVRSARLYICGLGYHEVFINGEKVGEHVLDPGWTAHRKQALYVTHDVTSMLKRGNNVAGIMLGNGWYNPLPIRLFRRFNLRDHQQTGRPVVKAQIHICYEDGSSETIITDEHWKTIKGPVLRNNVYLGEQYDARREIKGWNKVGADLSEWKPSIIEKGPDGVLTPQMQPAVKIQEIIRPVDIHKTSEGTYIVDMGVNFAGVARIKVNGKQGTRITLRYGEALHPDGSLNWLTTTAGHIKSMWGLEGGPGAPKDAFQEDSYILKGSGVETYMPRFTFHGFRYVEVTGWPGVLTKNQIEGIRMYADLETNGTFACSNEMFNQLHEVTLRTFLSNVFSVQSDCPGREKMGYGGDMVATAESFIYNYDMSNFYRKTVYDFINDQTPEGGMTEIVPYTGIADRGIGGESGPLGWQLAFPYLQKQLYDFYGDKRIIEECYPAFVRQIDFINSKTIEGLFHWDIGDHVALDPRAEAFSACAFYYEHVQLIAEFATILNKIEEAANYQKLADDIRQRIIRKYLVPGTGRFDNATQAAQIFALYYGLTPEPEATFRVLLDEYERHNWHVSTGIFSCKMGFDILREADRNDIAYRLVNQRDYPGWGYMLAEGATTLWESWEYPANASSQNHPMFGSTEEWFYRSLLGINPAKPGFKEIIIKPQPAGDLTWAKGSYNSVKGIIHSNWEIKRNTYTLSVDIPANTSATVYVKTNGKSAVSAEEGATFISRDKEYAVYKVPSGSYHFSSEI